MCVCVCDHAIRGRDRETGTGVCVGEGMKRVSTQTIKKLFQIIQIRFMRSNRMKLLRGKYMTILSHI